jgi:hypothetical protein
MDEKGVLLGDLKARQCRFVLRDGRSPPRFCGEPTLGAGSWCLEHRRIVFVASSQKELSLRRGTQTAASSGANALARLVADGVITSFSTSFGRPASELDLHVFVTPVRPLTDAEARALRNRVESALASAQPATVTVDRR